MKAVKHQKIECIITTAHVHRVEIYRQMNEGQELAVIECVRTARTSTRKGAKRSGRTLGVPKSFTGDKPKWQKLPIITQSMKQKNLPTSRFTMTTISVAQAVTSHKANAVLVGVAIGTARTAITSKSHLFEVSRSFH